MRLPYGPILTVAQTMTCHHELTEQSIQMGEGFGYETSESRPAGEDELVFLRSFVPLTSDEQGEYLYADTRPGQWNGSIGTFDWESGTASRLWRSISALLTDIADSLEHNLALQTHYHPTIDQDGNLRWASN
ncbi:hypothetical protein [Nocardia colli]|uniref:hypothetical protein n=1 Tax=Nocardia colli TaxID=2545717 RepID=UPI0035E1BF4E